MMEYHTSAFFVCDMNAEKKMSLVSVQKSRMDGGGCLIILSMNSTDS
jgi:hypothetical protein